MQKNTFVLVSVLLLGLAFVGVGFLYRGYLRDALHEMQKAQLPLARQYQEFPKAQLIPEEENEQTRQVEQEKEDLPAQINLDVPFTPQAPHANWDLPYQEACEEASLLMVARYKNGQAIASPEDADQEILKLVEFQNNFFGYYQDTTAEETAKIAREYYGFQDTRVIYDFTIDDIKREVASGNPVIVPAAGRILPNPYFTNPGPLYHMLVIRGYTEDAFITNDPGTRRGEEFVYAYDDLMEAAHDWNDGDVENGRRVMIVVK